MSSRFVSVSKRKDNMCFNHINRLSGFNLPCFTLSVCLHMWLEGDLTALLACVLETCDLFLFLVGNF